MDAELVKKEILAAGFEFDGESEILHHPEDTLDYDFRDVKMRRDLTDRFVPNCPLGLAEGGAIVCATQCPAPSLISPIIGTK